LGGSVAAAKVVRLRTNSADVYPGANNFAFNASGPLSPVDLYFEYTVTQIDYIASNGSTKMWDSGKTGATTHNNSIAIVGRDDTSALWQPKSRSVLTTGNPTIEVNNTANVADMEFLAVANDSTATGTQLTELAAGLPALTNARLIREWQVQKTGDVGNVNLSFDLSQHSVGANDMSLVKLLTDTDSNFTNATISTIVPTLSGTTITFTNVPTTDLMYFTVALPFNSKGPGGVTTGLKLWTRADRGVYTDTAGLTAATDGADVNLVRDQSGGGNDFTDNPTGGAPKLFVEPLLAYQNTLQFCRIANNGGNATTPYWLGTTFGMAGLGTNCAADIDYMYDANGTMGTGTYTDGALFTVAMNQYNGVNDGVFGEVMSTGEFSSYQLVTNGNHYARLGNSSTNELQTPLISSLNNTSGSFFAPDNTYGIMSMVGSTTNDGDGTIGQRTKRNGRVTAASTDATFT
jgi:hypothetical protein